MIRIDCGGLAAENLADTAQIQGAYDCLMKDGYAILDHVVAEDKILALRAEFYQRYARYLADQEVADTSQIGDRRYMAPLAFSGGFADPAVFANPYVIAVVREALEADAILEAYGAIVALSGAAAQHFHRDSPLLFNSAISAILPAYAVRLALPLVEMNELHGTTAIWPGSHRWTDLKTDLAPQYPVVPIGSCLLWDFRLCHRGSENRSAEHRPMVHATYARRWYHDPVNFEKKTLQRLIVEPQFLQGIPDDTRKLLSHVV